MQLADAILDYSTLSFSEAGGLEFGQRPFIQVSYWCSGMAISPDGKWVLSGGHDENVGIWDYQTGKMVHSFIGHSSWVDSVAFSSDGKQALSGSRDKTVRLWDCQTGKEVRSFVGHRQSVDSVVFSPDGKWVLSGSGDKTVRLWDSKTGKETYRLTFRYDIDEVKMLFDGKSIVVATDGAMQMWELFDESRRFQPSLKWGTGNPYLSAQHLNMDGIKGLSEENRRLLLQHGAGNEEKSSEFRVLGLFTRCFEGVDQ